MGDGGEESFCISMSLVSIVNEVIDDFKVQIKDTTIYSKGAIKKEKETKHIEDKGVIDDFKMELKSIRRKVKMLEKLKEID